MRTGPELVDLINASHGECTLSSGELLVLAGYAHKQTREVLALENELDEIALDEAGECR